MKQEKTFYITTTLPYVNSDPHIGFAAEIVHADILARYSALQGREVFFNTGTDEHGTKVYAKAAEAGKDPQKYVDEYAEKFRDLKGALGLSDNLNFVRTTDAHHKKAAQEFWKRVKANGYIEKKKYKTKYCVGCELEKTDSELVNGRCVIHPNLEIQIIEEENWFFKFSAFKEKLEEFYAKHPDFVVPDFRFNEIKAFVSRGLEDFSISRLKSKMPWGVDVPDDPDQVMYVWFDALVNYIDVLGWPEDEKNFKKFWPGIQIAGKDNLRQQSAMWQAMLMAADLPNSEQIIIRGFVTSGGQKMSKSLGNVVNPYDLVKEYGTDAVRYFLAREISPFEDSDFTMERFKEAYNSKLANGIGNLASRIMKMAETNLEAPVKIESLPIWEQYAGLLNHFEISKATDLIWREIAALDLIIQTELPFKLIKTDITKGRKIISDLVLSLHTVAQMLEPIMPETSRKIKEAVLNNKMPDSLFPRKD